MSLKKLETLALIDQFQSAAVRICGPRVATLDNLNWRSRGAVKCSAPAEGSQLQVQRAGHQLPAGLLDSRKLQSRHALVHESHVADPGEELDGLFGYR